MIFVEGDQPDGDVTPPEPDHVIDSVSFAKGEVTCRGCDRVAKSKDGPHALARAWLALHPRVTVPVGPMERPNPRMTKRLMEIAATVESAGGQAAASKILGIAPGAVSASMMRYRLALGEA